MSGLSVRVVSPGYQENVLMGVVAHAAGESLKTNDTMDIGALAVDKAEEANSA